MRASISVIVPVLLALTLPVGADHHSEADEAGFKPIFNGKDLTGWDGDPEVWSVKDGAITGSTHVKRIKKNTFCIWRQGQLDDFVLRLSYKIVDGNSGIQYRSKDLGDHVVGGYQADFEAGKTYSGILYEEKGRGILALRGQKVEIQPDGKKKVVGQVGDSDEIQAAIRNEDWNDYEIIARGNELIHKINGKVTSHTIDHQKDKRSMQGILAFQAHVGPKMTVQFKNVRLKRLPLTDGRKKVVFLAGTASHGHGSHEFNAGSLLLAKCLETRPDLLATVYQNYNLNDKNYHPDPTRFDNADALVYFMNGGGGHPVRRELEEVDRLARKGVGIACLHYAVEVPKGKEGGGAYFLDWIGGYFEAHYSVNPHWVTRNVKLAEGHPITRGVKPFEVDDEWYFNMRFRENLENVTPIYSAVPPPETMKRKDGAHSGNPIVREMVKKGLLQHLAWAYDRPGGGRGFGFTGAHYHHNWANEDFRKLILNALAWVAGAKVPEKGIEVELTPEELDANQDEPRRRRASAPRPTPPKGKPLFRSPVLGAGKVARVDVDIRGQKDLYLVVSDAGDGFGCDWADWIEPVLVSADGKKKSLTSVEWKSAAADWGQVRRGKNAGGGELKVEGKTHTDGIGTHANSIIHYRLPEGFARFQALCALDDGGTSQGCGSTVRFSVYSSKPPVSVARPSGGQGGGPLAPEEALEGIEVHEGVEIQLFAHEPLVANPTNMDIDHRGRVWITEGINYRRWKDNKPEGDRIVILEDTDLDGVADRSKVYYQDPSINSALGICVLGKRVIVSCSPNIFVFTDEDGDDRPDRKDVLFTGIRGVQHDHGAHAFLFGPDGKLYFNVGNDGAQLQRPDGSWVVDVAGNEVRPHRQPYQQGLAFRCDLDGSNVETLGWNFRNNYELTVDSLGTVWQSDNDDDGNRGVRINYVMQYGNYGYRDEMTGAGWRSPRTNIEEEIPHRHWHLNDPGVVPNFIQTGAGSPTGICVYEGRLLPEDFHDEVIHCDAGPNVVRAYRAHESGAGYRGEIVDLLKGTSDRWVRPADVCVAPDGSVYVADWYDAGVGGHNMADRDPKTARGRIYRLAPPGHRPAVPALDLVTPAGAVKALLSPNLATRYLGWQSLQKLGQLAEGELVKVWKEGRLRHRARALHVLARMKDRGSRYLREALDSPEPDLRVLGVRIAKDLGEDMIRIVTRLVSDSSPRVRRECALALRHHESDTMPKLWTLLAYVHDGQDRWYLEALGIAADGRWDECLETLLSRAPEPFRSPGLLDIIWRSRATQTPVLLADYLLSGQASPENVPRFLRAFDFQKGPKLQESLVRLLASSDETLRSEALARVKGFDPAKNAEHGKILGRLLDSVRGTPEFVQLVDRFDVSGHEKGLLKVLLGHPETSAAAIAARRLLRSDHREKLRSMLLGDDSTSALKVATAIGNSGAPESVALLEAAFASEESDPAVVAQAVRGLARSQAGARKLIALAREEELDDDHLAIAALPLSNATWKDVREAARELFPLPPTRDGQPLPPVAELIRQRGDAGRGRKVYETHCATCHQAGSIGKDFGPALTEIGDKLPREALLTSILDPNAGVSFDYLGESLVLSDGTQLSGIIISETDDLLTVKSQGAIVTRVDKKKILSREKVSGSLMPSGLASAMTRQELVDLVEFLTRLKKRS